MIQKNIYLETSKILLQGDKRAKKTGVKLVTSFTTHISVSNDNKMEILIGSKRSEIFSNMKEIWVGWENGQKIFWKHRSEHRNMIL